MSSSSSESGGSLQRLRSAVIDGRTANIRYRQKQLLRLHTALREKSESICSAIAKDTRAASAEVETEYFLTMSAIKESYDSLNFFQKLKEEYLTSTGADNTARRIGVGLVVLRPATHTRFYSIMCPLAASITAGNCLVLELGNTLLNVDDVLKEILPKALDADTFSIFDSQVSAKELETCFLVDQISSTSKPSSANQLSSSSVARSIAIVDRTANIDEAAKAIVAARFSFQGTSPYAPDLVIVNEFVKQKFFEACTREASQAFAGQTSPQRSSSNAVDATKKAIKEAESKGEVSSFGSTHFQLVDILDRESSLATAKVVGRCLPLMSCRSLMDAVYSQKPESTLLAGYFFADPAASKFLAQHLSPHLSLINQIPTHLLLGPSAPIDHASAYPDRYTSAMFSVSRPQYITPPSGTYSQLATVPASKLREQATKPLKKLDQGPGHAIGFFEQGILTGAIIWVSVLLPAVGYGSWVLGRKGWEMAMRR